MCETWVEQRKNAPCTDDRYKGRFLRFRLNKTEWSEPGESEHYLRSAFNAV